MFVCLLVVELCLCMRLHSLTKSSQEHPRRSVYDYIYMYAYMYILIHADAIVRVGEFLPKGDEQDMCINVHTLT